MPGRRVHHLRRDLLLGAVRGAGRISRAELAQRTGMARMTVTGLVDEMLASGVLAEEPARADGTRTGRPARVLTLGPAAGSVVGASVDEHGIRVAVADLTGTVRAERVDDAVGADLAALITGCVEEAGSGPVWSTVVGHLPGTPPPAGLPGSRVTARGLADLCLIGEVTQGVAVGRKNVCFLRVCRDVGCGLMLNGHLHTGAAGAAGEIGHVQIDETGALCRCGRRGCLETIVAPEAVLDALEAMHGDRLSVARALELSRHDATAERVLGDAGHMIGRVLAALAGTVNPEVVVLAGPMIEAEGLVVAEVREALRRYAPRELVDGTQVLVSELGERAALAGALALALHTLPGERAGRAVAAHAGPDGDGPGGVNERERAVRRRMITDLLRTGGATARSDIVRRTRLPRAAVADLLAGLHRDGVVEPATPPGDRPGRPSPHFRLASPAGLLVGLSLGGDGVRAVVADRAGRRIGGGFRPLPASPEGRGQIRDAAGFALELIAGHGHAPGPGVAVAMAVPAPVHPVTGEFGKRSVLPFFSGYSPAEDLAAQLGCPVRVFNNAQLAALGETRRGAARGARDVLYLKTSQHCGAGIVVSGRMYGGAIGYAGEISHLTVRDIGPLCFCGRRGCLSVFLQPGAFGAVLDRFGPPSQERLLELAAGGHGPARRALLDAGRLVGRTTAVLCNLLNPALVVVGGRFTEPGDQVVDGVRESLGRYCAPPVAAALTVVRAELGEEAEAIGAVESLL
ncbi:ROK family transcriptional regulator [Kineosporia sp. J2-2]|uniref:ROK family transcriptional regulator n=1 Tax=Kineosporia corallincola TaxID=2835133 RepID=A0ABS5TE70_9ACTN|nr:ROK family transcriptional regulator [Kineosporia corallincola]MBT0768521.1 ROK family transcriptional regulator [Kineosporia corallincola]